MKKWMPSYSSKNILPGFCCLLLYSIASAQKSNDLLVYAVKGTVTATLNNQESPVKIGKVLRAGTTLNIRQGARMTMLCKQGKPLSVSKEGSFPVTTWKDSCKTTSNSITSNYFKYIWTEFYSRSPEHAEDEKNVNAVIRGPAPVRTEHYPNRIKIEFSRGLDTLNYTGEDFPLSWTSYDYSGKYHFVLYDAKTGKVVFRDTLHRSVIPTSRFKEFLVPGKRYTWTVSAPGAGLIRRRVLNYVPAIAFEKYMETLEVPLDIPEEEATKNFRIAYILEQRHYLAAAYKWYKKAVEADEDMEICRDKLLRFKSEYWISE